MIPNQWYVVLESNQVKKKPVGVTRMGEKLVFWRDNDGKLNCFRDRCIHRGVQLSKGKVLDNGHLQCPFHGFEYDPTGRVTKIPANGKHAPVPERFKVHRYLTHEAHGFVWIWWGENPPVDLAAPRFFDDLTEGFFYGSVRDPWKAHYSRVVENQLDVVHLPFIHHNTIGRSQRTLVDGPLVEWVDDDKFFFYVYNRHDDGTPPRKPQDMPPPNPERDFRLGFIFPNIWVNYIGDSMRVMAAFVPVDDHNTLLYLRTYQRFMRVPGIAKAFTQLIAPFNFIIAHQDRHVVETHQPPASQLQGSENLIQGDRPVVAYRKRRAELLAEAAALNHK